MQIPQPTDPAATPAGPAATPSGPAAPAGGAPPMGVAAPAPAAPAPAPATQPSPAAPPAQQQAKPQQGQPQPDPPMTVVDAMDKFFQSVDGTRADRRQLEATAKKYAGREAELWRHLSRSNGNVLSDKAIEYMAKQYDNPFSSKKKASGDASAASSSPSSGSQPAQPAAVPSGGESPAVAPAGGPTPGGKQAAGGVSQDRSKLLPVGSGEPDPLQDFVRREIYGSQEGDYDVQRRDVQRRAAAQITALSMREGQGKLTAEQAEQRRKRIEEEQASHLAMIDAHETAKIPVKDRQLGLVGPDDQAEPAMFATPEIRSLFLGAQDYYLDLGAKLETAYGAMDEISSALLGGTTGKDRGFLLRAMNDRYGSGRSGHEDETFDNDRLQGLLRKGGMGDRDYFRTEYGSVLFSQDMEGRLRQRMAADGVELPEAFYDFVGTNGASILRRNQEAGRGATLAQPSIADFSRFDNPMKGMLADVADEYLNQHIPPDTPLRPAERVAMKQRIMAIGSSAYRLKESQTNARKMLADQGIQLPDGEKLTEVLDQVDRYTQLGQSQMEAMHSTAEGKLRVMGQQLKAELAAFDQAAATRIEKQKENLQLLIQTGQLDQDGAQKRMAEITTEAMDERNRRYNERTTEMASIATAFEREQKALLDNLKQQVNETFSTARLTPQEDGTVSIDPQLLALYGELVDQELGAAERSEFRRQQQDYARLGTDEKVQRALGNGFMNVLESIGGGVSWLGDAEAGWALTQQARATLEQQPLFSTGEEFSLEDLSNPDWWISNAVPQVPLAATLMIPGAGFASVGSRLAATAGLGKAGTLWTMAGAGAVGSRLLEGGFEAGMRWNQSIAMGKTPEQAASDATNVAVGNAGLVFFDALQLGLAMKAGKMLRTVGKGHNYLRKGAKFVGGTTVASLSEGLEEIGQGYLSTIQDRPISFLDYAMSPEGQHSGVLGAAFGVTFHLAMGGVSDLFARDFTKPDLLQEGKQVDMVNRARQKLAAVELLHLRGELPEVEYQGIKASLNTALQSSLKALNGALPGTIVEHALPEYVSSMAEVARIEAEMDAAGEDLSDSQRKMGETRIQELRDRMATIEASDADLTTARLAGMPMTMEVLGDMLQDARVVGHINLATELDVQGNALDRVELFSNLGRMNPEQIGAENAAYAMEMLEEAILELSQNPDRPSGISALYEYATNNYTRSQKGDGRKWGAVVKAIDQARQGKGGAILRDAIASEDSSPGIESADAAAESQHQAQQELGNEGQQEAEAAAEPVDQVVELKTKRAEDNLAGAVEDVFISIWEDDASVDLVAEVDGALADRVERAAKSSQVSLADKVRFNQIVREKRAAEGYGVPHRTRTAEETRTDAGKENAHREAMREQQQARADLWFAMELNGEVWAAMEEENPALFERTYEEVGFQELSPEDFSAVQEFLAEVSDRVESSRIKNMDEAHIEAERERLEARIEELTAQLNSMLDITKVELQKLGFIPPLRRTESSKEYYDIMADATLRAEIMNHIKVLAVSLIEARSVGSFAEFMEVMIESQGKTRVDKLHLGETRNAWKQAVEEVKLRSENPLNYYAQLGTRHSLIRTFVDARVGLRILEEKITEHGEEHDPLDNNRPSDLFETVRSRVDIVAQRIARQIRGLAPGTFPGAAARDAESLTARWQKETGEGIDVLSLYLYAKHARDFNAQARKLGMARLMERVEEVSEKIAAWEIAVKEREARVKELEKLQSQELGKPGTNAAISEALADARRTASSARSRRTFFRNKLEVLTTNQDDNTYLITAGSGMSDSLAEHILETFDAKVTESGESFDVVADRFYKEIRETLIDARTRLAYEGGLIDKDMHDNLLANQRAVYHYDPETGMRLRDENGNYMVTYEEGFANYVPLRVKYGEFNLAQGPMGRSSNNPGNSGQAFVQSIEGTDRYTMLQRNNPIEQALADYVETVRQVEHNNIMQELLALAKSNPDPRLWRPIRSSARPTFDHQGFMTGMADNVSDEIKKHSVPVLVDGRLHYLHFMPIWDPKKNDHVPHPVLAAIERHGMGSPGDSNLAVRALLSVTRLQINLKRAMITSLNPFFGVPNFARDFVDSLSNMASADVAGMSRAKIAGRMLAKVPSAFAVLMGRGTYDRHGEVIKNGSMARMLQDAIEDGMMMSWSNPEGVDKAEKTARRINRLRGRIDYTGGLTGNAAMRRRRDPEAKGVGAKTKDAAGVALDQAKHSVPVVAAENVANLVITSIDHFNGAFENTMRLAAYAAAREAGVPRTRAAALGKNISVNFERNGTATPWINSLYLFANAGIQGTYRSARNLTTRGGQITLGSFVMLGVLQGLVMDDDDDYQENTTSYDRQSQWLVPRMWGHRYKMPKPYGLVRMAANLGENLVRASTGRDDLATFVSNTFDDLRGTIDPVGGQNANTVSAYLPTIAQFPAQYYMNENFMGAPFYNDWDRFGDTQDEVGKAPEWIQNFTRSAYENSGGYLNIAPAFAWEFLKDQGGGLLGEALRYNRYRLDENPNKALVDNLPIARRFYDSPVIQSYKWLSPLYAQMEQDKMFKPTEREHELHRKLYKKVGGAIREAERGGYKAPMTWRGYRRMAREYEKKFGVSLY